MDAHTMFVQNQKRSVWRGVLPDRARYPRNHRPLIPKLNIYGVPKAGRVLANHLVTMGVFKRA